MTTWLLLLLACAPARAGELWLTITDDDVRIHLPADALADAPEPVWVEQGPDRVDLRVAADELKGGRVGATRRFALDGGAELVLGSERVAGPPASQVALEIVGPKGNGLTLTFPLQPDALGQVQSALDGSIDVEGVDLRFDEETCAQLRRSPPTRLLDVSGPDGGGFHVSTR